MKKLQSFFLVTLIIFSLSTKPAHALFGMGDIVFDPSAFAKQLMQYAQEYSTAISSSLGAVNQQIDTLANLAKPIFDAVTIAQQAQQDLNIKNLVTASLGGDALLVSNPKLYLQNKGIAVNQLAVDSLATQTGLFSNSVMSSIVAKAKVDNSSLPTKLAQINKTSITAAELQKPSLDTFYKITSGYNAYTKAQLSQIATDKAAEEAKTAAAKDLASGGGVKSKTTCTKTASNGLCVDETIKQAGSVLNKAYSGAVNPDTAKFALGSTISRLFGSFASISSLLGMSGSSNNTSNVTAGTVTAPNTPNVTTTTTTGYPQNLANDPATKAAIASAPQALLQQDQKTLTDIIDADKQYLNTTNLYNNELDKMKTCYDNLLTSYPDDLTPGDSRISKAVNFYNQHKNTNNAAITRINLEIKTAGTTVTLVSGVISVINNSNSADEIASVYQNYQNQVKNQGLINLSSSSFSLSAQVQLEMELQVSLMQGGDLNTLNSECSTLRQQLEFQKNGGYTGAGGL